MRKYFLEQSTISGVSEFFIALSFILLYPLPLYYFLSGFIFILFYAYSINHSLIIIQIELMEN